MVIHEIIFVLSLSSQPALLKLVYFITRQCVVMLIWASCAMEVRSCRLMSIYFAGGKTPSFDFHASLVEVIIRFQ